MDQSIDHNELDAALRRCGSTWNAGQSHGLLCGRLTILGAEGGSAWLKELLEGLEPHDASLGECRSMLDALGATTYRQLAERRSEFSLLVPEDEESMSARTHALAQWCDGYLHGLVSDVHGEELKRRLAREPMSDIIRDFLEISRAGVDDADDDETNETAYTELVEYLRVAVQLAYEELADVRNPTVFPSVAVAGGSKPGVP